MILFCATGVTDTVGGIAAANRNVLAALQRLAVETHQSVETLALGEHGSAKPGYRTFGGNKIGFTLAALIGTLRSRLVVVDHVRLAGPLLALPRPLRPPIVICAHGSEATWAVRPSSVKAFRKADLVLTNSNFTLTRMAARISDFKGVACPLGLSPQLEVMARPPAQSTEQIALESVDGVMRDLGDQVLLLVARMDAGERMKGHRELIRVFPRLLDRFPGAQLVLVGSGTDLQDLSATARASTAAGGIFLPGKMVDHALEALYRKSYAFVMPSRQEGFGLVYLEAMNHAKPCLACQDDGGADVVVDGETGVLVAHDFDDDDLLEGLSGILIDRERARRYGMAGWRRLMQQFTSQAHQDRVADFLRPLLAGQPGD